MQTTFRPAIMLFGALTLAVGVLYPLAVTGIGYVAFPDKVRGSLVTQGGKTVGSSLIGQSFTSPGYFWGRPSATAPMANNAAASSGSNQGPLNPALVDAVKGRVAALRALDPGNTALVPVDLVTASASGLDPEISLAAARYQAGRVASARKLPRERVEAIIKAAAIEPVLGVFGEARVNVLALNLALDAER
ncbi:potassium-transporting ATPase subunit KdpC [Massilia atriviolacea]|uniref:Potassium-transporting ATPase KdpC subunit n=1 Tax=Massilia atriviolacea TaxID=2495579 RepID=A0A430HPG7_9BURK|nr:potassium-transporting ATPase subunit KdpC [Massilia atriviolacea]RSZ59412.1 potassium-transporting ATPase subunit KdpC [Massilia atriviolacea]